MQMYVFELVRLGSHAGAGARLAGAEHLGRAGLAASPLARTAPSAQRRSRRAADHRAQLSRRPEDMRRMADGVRIAWRMMHDGPSRPMLKEFVNLQRREVVNSDSALEDFSPRQLHDDFPPGRHRKMGPENDPMAVVDQYCRVRGVEGLRVVDASVMPNIVRANTNLTCIMIGERVADWMRNAD